MSSLLSREMFTRQVLARLGGRCAFCKEPAVDAHHIFDRHLFLDGGYYMNNGAPVCSKHHWFCEMTVLSVSEVVGACGIKDNPMPPHLLVEGVYDKWGNRLRVDGTRAWGPMSDDSGARKALARGGMLGLFRPSVEGDEWAFQSLAKSFS